MLCVGAAPDSAPCLCSSPEGPGPWSLRARRAGALLHALVTEHLRRAASSRTLPLAHASLHPHIPLSRREFL